ncbi:MAG TPA: helix-turn-helix domain-containing protein [Acidimicrobiales bacterium]
MKSTNPSSESAAGRRPYEMAARADAVSATRQRIAEEAMRLFIAQDYDDVTLAAIATAAGVSHQTVLNHFRNKEGVVRAAAEILGDETVEARNAARPGDVAGAVAALVGEYERFGDANVRWALTADRLASLAPILDEARANHQRWLVEMFDSSLPRSAPARRSVVQQLHVATDVYSWKLLRRDLALDRADTERVLTEMVRAILAAAGADAPSRAATKSNPRRSR